MAVAGQYKGKDINTGTDAEIAAQMAAIDAAANTTNATPKLDTKSGEVVSGKDAGGDSVDLTKFLGTLTDKLMNQSIVSSDTSSFEKKISGIVEGIQKGNEASKARIESSFNRQIQDAIGAGEQDVVNKLESRSGFATVTAVIRNSAELAQKNVKDLEMRKQELLLAGDAAAAEKITELQFKELEFEQKARQDAFNNLLGIGQFVQGTAQLMQQIKNDAASQSFQQQQLALDQARLDLQKTDSEYERNFRQQEINLRQQEIAIQAAKEGKLYQPDPGFADIEIQNDVGASANAILEKINSDLQMGMITEEEATAKKLEWYSSIRRVYSRDQITDDGAILKAIGFDIQDAMNTAKTLPGEKPLMSSAPSTRTTAAPLKQNTLFQPLKAGQSKQSAASLMNSFKGFSL